MPPLSVVEKMIKMALFLEGFLCALLSNLLACSLSWAPFHKQGNWGSRNLPLCYIKELDYFLHSCHFSPFNVAKVQICSPVIHISLLTHSGPTLTKTPQTFSYRSCLLCPPVVLFLFFFFFFWTWVNLLWSRQVEEKPGHSNHTMNDEEVQE